jgi:hypothetical protein
VIIALRALDSGAHVTTPYSIRMGLKLAIDPSAFQLSHTISLGLCNRSNISSDPLMVHNSGQCAWKVRAGLSRWPDGTLLYSAYIAQLYKRGISEDNEELDSLNNPFLVVIFPYGPFR